ncbi:hypothetical protein GH741_13515 [Aquibacillus halophilus]|uniref:Integral membrane protein n=1 Tax=Aquibacillus halophilus TaxID=930132 RepID=A0A6A8DEL8_9BACI|nr:hypothetical protein [Aquibacillus halophilus]MRH43690.1 hypothetical protein [Aquibacillus halophilus]
MIEFIFEYRWLILIGSEVIFWCTFIIFLVLRYLYDSKAQNLFLALSILNQFLNIPLAALDYYNIQRISFFQISVLFIYIYAITRGRKDMYKLDLFILRKVAKIKNNSGRGINCRPLENASGLIHAKIERQKFYIHLLLYLLTHVFFFFSNPQYSIISMFWSVFLLIDALWSFSFTFFRYDKNKQL